MPTDIPHMLSRFRAGDPPSSALIEAISKMLRGLPCEEHDPLDLARVASFVQLTSMHGLGAQARSHLSRTVTAGGVTLAWQLEAPVIDVANLTSVSDAMMLILAPALAVCGAAVPLCEREGAFAPEGASLFALEAIPGVSTDMSRDRFQQQVHDLGLAFGGVQSALAPSELALSDLCEEIGATDCADLLTVGLLAPRKAAGLEALVFNIGFGAGGLVEDHDAARALGLMLVETAQDLGLMSSAVLTNHDQLLGGSLGSALEVAQAMQLLCGEKTPIGSASERLLEAVAVIGGEVLALGGMCADSLEGEKKILHVIENGAAAKRLACVIHSQGGPADFLEHWRDRLPAAPVVLELRPDQPGVVHSVDVATLAQITAFLGHSPERFDHAAGLSEIARIGDSLTPEMPLARVHAATEDVARAVLGEVYGAFTLKAKAQTPPSLVAEILR